MKIRAIIPAVMLAGTMSVAHAQVCKIAPGSVTCGKGTVSSLTGNGLVSVNETTVEGATIINGMLSADYATFTSLNVNGSTTLMQCVVNSDTEIKGALKASATKFLGSLDVFSNSTKLMNCKVSHNIQVHHTDHKNQEVYLDNNTEVAGDIVFDDGHGKVYVRGGSKINGQIIGGELVS